MTHSYLPPDVTEEELAMLDVDLERPWHGVMGEVWGRRIGPVERLAGRVLRSAIIWTPIFVLFAGLFVFYLLDTLLNGGDRGGTWP